MIDSNKIAMKLIASPISKDHPLFVFHKEVMTQSVVEMHDFHAAIATGLGLVLLCKGPFSITHPQANRRLNFNNRATLKYLLYWYHMLGRCWPLLTSHKETHIYKDPCIIYSISFGEQKSSMVGPKTNQGSFLIFLILPSSWHIAARPNLVGGFRPFPQYYRVIWDHAK